MYVIKSRSSLTMNGLALVIAESSILVVALFQTNTKGQNNDFNACEEHGHNLLDLHQLNPSG